MSDDDESLSDIWLELELITLSAEFSDDERVRLVRNLSQLKYHVDNNQVDQRKVILRWFRARLSSRLYQDHYRKLLLELSGLLASLWSNDQRFNTADEVMNWLDGDFITKDLPEEPKDRQEQG